MAAIATLPVISRSPEPVTEQVTLLDLLLREQQELTAVERFAERHEACAVPAQARYYSDLLPATPPGPGEQYAFEVDLDRCSGCKACVTACHTLNGLDEDETWRSVGLLHGGSPVQNGSPQMAIVQHVTTACHHCVDPACMNGCPVKAYEKDPLTGIVRHLDDQCIGCQYCVLACPYDVPKFNHKRGIVRKCDMCSQRLAVNEAPACVQACPHQAIRIKTVNVADVRRTAEANVFLPGAPEPDYTLPTTHYKTSKPLPRNLLPADYYTVRPEHNHAPLVAMLVLTQLGAGVFVIEAWMLASGLLSTAAWTRLHPVISGVGLAIGLIGLNAALLHLGRPLYAFRALMGLRTSWLSREILAFSIFAGIAQGVVAAAWAPFVAAMMPAGIQPLMLYATALTGLASVACSAMIYEYTRREMWGEGRTLTRFFLTSGWLGAQTALFGMIAAGVAFEVGHAATSEGYLGIGAGKVITVAYVVMLFAAAKLAYDLAFLGHLRSRRNTSLKRSAHLMVGALVKVTFLRFLLGAVGGIGLPWLMVQSLGSASAALPSLFGLAGMAVVGLALSLASEFCERYLFFTAAVAPRMPGGQAG